VVLQKLPQAIQAPQLYKRINHKLVDKVLQKEEGGERRKKKNSLGPRHCRRPTAAHYNVKRAYLNGDAEEVKAADVFNGQADEKFGGVCIVRQRGKHVIVQIVLRHILHVVFEIPALDLLGVYRVWACHKRWLKKRMAHPGHLGGCTGPYTVSNGPRNWRS
jgi:hypothetical protein